MDDVQVQLTAGICEDWRCRRLRPRAPSRWTYWSVPTLGERSRYSARPLAGPFSGVLTVRQPCGTGGGPPEQPSAGNTTRSREPSGLQPHDAAVARVTRIGCAPGSAGPARTRRLGRDPVTAPMRRHRNVFGRREPLRHLDELCSAVRPLTRSAETAPTPTRRELRSAVAAPSIPPSLERSLCSPRRGRVPAAPARTRKGHRRVRSGGQPEPFAES